MTSSRDAAAIDRWVAADLAAAVLPADRAFVAESAGVRALIVGLAQETPPSDELFDACAVLGGLVAQHGGSPTLASATFEHAIDVLGSRSAPWVGAARGAVAEGFTRVVLDQAHREAMAAWEFPHCVVSIDAGVVAVAASHPSNDPEAVSEWAARVAKNAALGGVRRAIVSGRDAQAIVDSLAIMGIPASRT